VKIIYYLIIILFTPILLLVNFRLLVFNLNFYKVEFAKLGVYENFASSETVNFEAGELINFYCCDGELSSTFYSQRERLHLMDVKNLIKLVNLYLYVLIWAALTCLVYVIHKKAYKFSARNLNTAALITIISIITLWLFSKLNFDPLFISFHKLSFSNNYWLLPQDANLIKLFPPQFFVDFANQIALQTMIMATIILIITHLISKHHAAKKR